MEKIAMKSLILSVLVASGAALASDEVDVTKYYKVSTEGSTAQVRKGEKGKFVFSIETLEGAYVSDEAPLRIELKGTNATVAQQKLTLKDSVAKNTRTDKKTADPRFEVPFDTTADTGQIDAKATFFICTKNICARQQKNLTIPFETIAAAPGKPTSTKKQ